MEVTDQYQWGLFLWDAFKLETDRMAHLISIYVVKHEEYRCVANESMTRHRAKLTFRIKICRGNTRVEEEEEEEETSQGHDQLWSLVFQRGWRQNKDAVKQ